jgi:hypothetical protein
MPYVLKDEWGRVSMTPKWLQSLITTAVLTGACYAVPPLLALLIPYREVLLSAALFLIVWAVIHLIVFVGPRARRPLPHREYRESM